MAQAHKCDRCGKFYEKNTRSWNNQPPVFRIEIVRGQYNNPSFELCDSCFEKLDNWIHNNQNFERNEQ